MTFNRFNHLISHLIIFGFLACQTQVNAQTDFESDAPVNPGGLINMRIPFSLSQLKKGEMNVTVTASEGNVWLPQVTLFEPKGMSPAMRALIESESPENRAKTIQQYSIPNRMYTYLADGTIHSQKIDFQAALTDEDEVGISFNMAFLSRGKTFLEYPVSDSFIESMHSGGIGQPDNFGRKLYPFNQAAIQFTDSEGKSMQLKGGDILLGTFDIHYIHHVELVHEDEKKVVKLLTLNLGAYAGIPMNQYLEQVPLAVSAELVTAFRLSSKVELNAALGGSITENRFIRWGEPIALSNADANYQIHAFLGVSIKSKRDVLTTIGIQHEEYSSFAKEIPDMGVVKPVAENGQTPKWWVLNPNQFGGKIAGFRGAPTDQYFDLVTSVQKKGMSVSIFLKEDFKVNNAPDLQLGLQWNMRIPKRTKQNVQ